MIRPDIARYIHVRRLPWDSDYNCQRLSEHECLIEFKVRRPDTLYSERIRPTTFMERRAMIGQVPMPSATSRIAVTVMERGSGPVPCPFFGKCDGIVVHDAHTGTRELYRNPPRTPESLCDLLLATGVDGLICGFIGDPEIRRLRAAGIDVRLGSGRYSVEELVACFCDLPAAKVRYQLDVPDTDNITPPKAAGPY